MLNKHLLDTDRLDDPSRLLSNSYKQDINFVFFGLAKSGGYFNNHILLKHYQLCNPKFSGTTSDKASTDTVHPLSLLFYSHFTFNVLFSPFPFSVIFHYFPNLSFLVNNHLPNPLLSCTLHYSHILFPPNFCCTPSFLAHV